MLHNCATAGSATTDPDTTDLTGCHDTTVDVQPTIVVIDTANPTSVSQPGGSVTFTFFSLEHVGEAVARSSLSDSEFGTLAGDADCKVGTVLGAGASCDFSEIHFISGDTSDPAHLNTFTATATDDENNVATDDDDATVSFEDGPPTISLDKAVDVSTLAEPGGVFTYTLTVTNDSVETVTITSLTDTQSGDAVGFSTCDDLVGDLLAPGASTSCTYTVSHTDAGTYPNTAERRARRTRRGRRGRR